MTRRLPLIPFTKKGITLNTFSPTVASALVKGALAFASIVVVASVRANDIDPFGFEKEHFITSKARAEVVADLKAAQASGQLPVAGEIGVRAIDTPSIKARAQVVAETLEAARLGLLTYGELGPQQATPAQEHQIELAGMRAVAPSNAAKRTTGRSDG